GYKPWIVGFSGGKDSTMLLQLVWYALMKVKPRQRKRPIHVICNNTLVENPQILEYVEKVLKKIEKAAHIQKLPITVSQTTPRIEDSFWINLIGKGYPAPNNMFRWCTERLKISPTSRFILEKINENGEVIILLGTRSDESSNRSRSIKRHEVKGSRLRRHTFPKAYVYAPIKDVLTEEVWQYLLAAKSPWGGKNRDLVTLYGNASGGDCPLVTDISTPSCGNSRFGCWVCTVVRKDKSMEGLIENGEDWMEPLLEIRDFLSETINRESPTYDPHKYRMNTRRNGTLGLGPYQPKWRKHVLVQVLKAQAEIQKTKKNVSLISNQELVAIQVIWYRDNIFEYDVPTLYKEIYGRKFRFSSAIDQNIKNEKELLLNSCDNDINDFNLINELLSLQKSKVLLMNNWGLQKDLEKKLEEHLYPSKDYVY
ncbi:MAG: DNA phosphorothioation system sulfurtransferase DndC, partial [Bacteroidota bacterium]